MSSKRKNVVVVGVGNIGSRHLQAVKNINFPLNIFAIDPSNTSLKTAAERYNLISAKTKHDITFAKTLDVLPNVVDVAIVATNSDIRAKVIKNLLAKSKVNYMILEKILFNKKSDYKNIGNLLERYKCRAFVNCTRRTQQYYQEQKNEYSSKPLILQVTGGNYELASNAIHFIDLIAYFTNCYEYNIYCDSLIPRILPSKRRGFIELHGTLVVSFKDGSVGIITRFAKSNAPILVEIRSNDKHIIINESEKKSKIAKSPRWRWKEKNIALPYQSDTTNKVVDNLLTNKKCNLTPFSKSAQVHLVLLEGLKKYLNTNFNKRYSKYPFS